VLGRISTRRSAGHLRAKFFEEVHPGKPDRVVDCIDNTLATLNWFAMRLTPSLKKTNESTPNDFQSGWFSSALMWLVLSAR
jgi:hypothetical protein